MTPLADLTRYSRYLSRLLEANPEIAADVLPRLDTAPDRLR